MHADWPGTAAAPKTLSRRSACIIAAFCASLFLLGLGDRRVLTSHEVVFAQPAREMLASGNWIIPTIAGVPVTEKPPFTYWAIAASMWLFNSDSEWVVRLPSVGAALVLALLTAGFAARWFGDRVGLTAGLMQLTSYYVLQAGRVAESDMLLVAAVSAAMFSLGLARVDSPRGRSGSRWLGAVFYLAAGLAFLIKGLIGPVIIFSGALLFLLAERDWRGFRFLLNPLGLVVFSLLVLAWPIAACLAWPPFLDDQVRHHFGRFRGDLGGHKPPYFYAGAVALGLSPWTPLAAWAACRGWLAGWLRSPLWRLAACWIAPGMLLLCASAWKHQHYCDPLLPPLVILGAVGMMDYLAWRRQTRRPWRAFWAVLGLALAAAAAVAVSLARPRGETVILGLVGLLAAAWLLLLYFEARGWVRAQLGGVFVTAWLVIAAALNLVMPHHDSYREQTRFARRAAERVPPGQTVRLVGLPEYQVTYYLRRRLERIDVPQQLLQPPRQHLAEFYLLAPRHVLEGLSPLGQVQVLEQLPALRKIMREEDRLMLARFTRPNTAQARPPRQRRTLHGRHAPPAKLSRLQRKGTSRPLPRSPGRLPAATRQP